MSLSRTGIVLSERPSSLIEFPAFSTSVNVKPLSQFVSPVNPGAPVGGIYGCAANGEEWDIKAAGIGGALD